MTSIHQRPPEINEPVIPGHWVRQFASKITYFSLRYPSVYAGFRPHFWKCM